MKTRKFLSFVVVIAMLMSVFPNRILAEDTENVTFTALDGTANNGDDQNYTKLLDGKEYTKWCDKVGTEDGKTYIPYIVFKASKKVVITDYTLMTGGDSYTWTGRNPKDWTLYGCNDYNEADKSGGTWTAIHTVTDDAVMQDLNKASYTFNIDGNTSMYQYYKLEITANHGADFNLMQLTKMEIGWSTVCYVTFDKNGGDTDASPSVIQSGNGLPATNPTKTDCIFLGWFTKDGTNGDWGEEFTAETTVSDGITVYAKWKQLYWVTFDSNGGTTLATNKIYHGDPIPAEIPTKTDFKFGGWFTKDGTKTGDWGEQYSSDIVVTSNITVYAKWNTVNITFDKNGGDTDANPKIISSGEAFPSVEPTYNGHRFIGWYTQNGTNGNWGEQFTKKMSDDALTDITVYAKWDAVTITFNSNGGDTEVNPIQLAYGQLPTTEPAKTGFIFDGWYTKDGTDGDWGDKYLDNATLYSDTTVYAKWKVPEIDCLADVTLTAVSGTPGNNNESYDKLVDGKKVSGNFTKWCVSNFSKAEIILKASAYTVPIGYILTTGNDTASQSGRNPKNWVLYASNDYNETEKTGTWTAIHTVTNDTVLQAKNYTSYTYTFENTKAYKYFKFEITAVQSGSLMQLGEFELTSTDCLHTFGTPTVTAPSCTVTGKTIYTCTQCGLSVTSNEITAPGHIGENGVCSVCHEPYGAFVDNTFYGDLHSAVEAANLSSTDTTIKLNQDFYINQSLEFDTSNIITLDLNGYTIKSDGSCRVILANCDLILTDSSTAKTGSVKGGSETQGGGIYVNKTLTVNGGTISNCSAIESGGAVYLNGSDCKLIMNGGTISNCSAASESYRKGGGAVFCAADSVLELKGGTITDCTAKYGAGIYNYAGNVTISGGTVSNNTATFGGAVYTAGGNVNITGGILSGNHASEGGGAILHASDLSVASVLTMNGGEISGNYAYEGGGIYVEKDATFTLNSGVIKNNSSGYGGGITNQGTTVINGGTISGNYAEWSGGGILNYKNYHYNYLSTLTITGGEIKNNTASKSTGGGIDLSSGNATISNAVIKDNTAKKQGGGIYYDGSSLTMTDCTISGNSGYGGGGICLYGNVVGTLNNCIITGNTATNSESGGGILADKGATLNLNGGEIKNNTAGGNGGGISAYSESTVNVSGTPIISGNTAKMNGGGIQLAYSSNLNMTGGTVENNQTTDASRGTAGGIMFDDSIGTISNTLIKGNSSTSLAGGIHIEGSTVTIENTQITENNAKRGGGLSAYENANITIKGGKISKNNSIQGCGLRMDSDSTVTLQDDAEISENGSPNGYYKDTAIFGGGVWISSSTLNLNGGNIINNHAENGGGIYTYNSDVVLNLTKGNITGNTAFFESGGIASKTNNIIIKGGVQITKNKKTATDACSIDSNVYLRNGTTIQVENPITQTDDGVIYAEIGVHVEKGSSNVIAANNTDYRQYFFTDSAGGTLMYDATDRIVKLGGTCTVSFDCGNKTTIATAVRRNTPVAEIATVPTRDGYYFGGWELDYNMYDFSQNVTKDIVLKAKWLDADKFGISITPSKIYIVSGDKNATAYGATYNEKQLVDTEVRKVTDYEVIELAKLELNMTNADKISLFVWDENLTPLCDAMTFNLN